jgi:hypothetical protein
MSFSRLWAPFSSAHELEKREVTPMVAPKDLFATPNPQGSDVSRDGLRMLLNVRTAETAPTPITLVLDWTAGLSK